MAEYYENMRSGSQASVGMVFRKNRGKAKTRICGTKAEEAGTHHMARLNTGQNSGKSMTNHKTMQAHTN